LVCWRGLSVLMDILCRGFAKSAISTSECDNFGMKVAGRFHFLAIKEEWPTCFPFWCSETFFSWTLTKVALNACPWPASSYQEAFWFPRFHLVYQDFQM
jgi:hypothetical protein